MFQVVAKQFIPLREVTTFLSLGLVGFKWFSRGNHLGLSSLRISQQKKYIYFNIYLLKLMSNFVMCSLTFSVLAQSLNQGT